MWFTYEYISPSAIVEVFATTLTTKFRKWVSLLSSLEERLELRETGKNFLPHLTSEVEQSKNCFTISGSWSTAVLTQFYQKRPSNLTSVSLRNVTVSNKGLPVSPLPPHRIPGQTTSFTFYISPKPTSNIFVTTSFHALAILHCFS